MTDTEQTDYKLTLRSLKKEDYPHIKRIMDLVYAGMGGAWTPEEFAVLIDHFSEGQICIEDKGKVIAAALAIIVNSQEFEKQRHTYEDVVSGGEMTSHDPEGDALYGVDIFVDPDYRGLRLGRRLYDARKELCETLNLKSILFGGRKAYPHDAIAAEATPNTEMTLMVDLDLDLLKELRQKGSVRNLKSRRRELYEVLWKPDLAPDGR